jgi:predicted GNAT family N-acyltransferase
MTSPANEHSVRILAWEHAIELARPIREAVFVHEQGVSIEEEWDEWDVTSDHAIAFDPDGQPIGTGRLMPRAASDKGEVRVGRMAVLKPWRGLGVGAALLAALLDLAASQGVEEVVLFAQTRAAPFYQRYGFEAEGPEFMEAGIPHLVMRRSLARR